MEKFHVGKKGIIYYTNNRLDQKIFVGVQKLLLETKLPIISISLEPIEFARNIVLKLDPGPVTMTKQILTALEQSNAEIVFFCEHDVLYHPSHFEFTPPRNDIFYYNVNVWRWEYPKNRLITYDHLKSLSGLCVYRKLALAHWQKRMKMIEENGWGNTSREPRWIRKLGYEPGKSKSSIPEIVKEWKSLYPNIDIRHRDTVSPPKIKLENFKNKPTGWREEVMENIPCWDLKIWLKN